MKPSNLTYCRANPCNPCKPFCGFPFTGPTGPQGLQGPQGIRTAASGDSSHAAGLYTIAQNDDQPAIGTDYAEMFEWLDGNAKNEDRRGFFVTLDGECIRKATDCDDYVLGVVSAKPAFVSDAWGCGWQGMYLYDPWGEPIYEWVEQPQEDAVFNEATGQIEKRTEMTRMYVPKLNPAHDPTREYRPRAARPEWAAVGLMGKLTVRDNGSCKPNGYCRPNAQGAATASERGYRVLKRLSTDLVRILLG